MLQWFLLSGSEPEKLKTDFIGFYTSHRSAQGMALWKWKKTCWICAPEKFNRTILTAFAKYRVVEFSSAPSPSDIEFIYGDEKSLNALS
jgi:hypothetical protein